MYAFQIRFRLRGERSRSDLNFTKETAIKCVLIYIHPRLGILSSSLSMEWAEKGVEEVQNLKVGSPHLYTRVSGDKFKLAKAGRATVQTVALMIETKVGLALL